MNGQMPPLAFVPTNLAIKTVQANEDLFSPESSGRANGKIVQEVKKLTWCT